MEHIISQLRTSRSSSLEHIVNPVLSYFFCPSRCPDAVDNISLSDSQLDLARASFICLDVFLTSSSTPWTSSKEMLSSWWPGIAKWTLCTFQRAIDSNSVLEGHWKCLLLMMLTFYWRAFTTLPGSVAATTYRSPAVTRAMLEYDILLIGIAAEKYKLGVHEPTLVGEEAAASNILGFATYEIWKAIGTAAHPDATRVPLNIKATASSKFLCKLAMATFVEVLSKRPVPFKELSRAIHSVNGAACVSENRFYIREQRAVYWCMMAAWTTVKSIPTLRDSKDAHMQTDMISTLVLALTYVYYAVTYSYHETVPELMRMKLFQLLVDVQPLVDIQVGSDSALYDLRSAIQRLLARLTPFSVSKRLGLAVGPYLDALKEYPSEFFSESEKSTRRHHSEVLSEIHLASLTFDLRARKICWYPAVSLLQNGDVLLALII